MLEIFSNHVVIYVVIPILILVSRVIDVSLGTIRVILANKGIKVLPAIIGFFEVMVWLLVITTVMKNLDNVVAYIAYATGFALGTFLGIYLEDKISIGQVRLTIITRKRLAKKIDNLSYTKHVLVTNSVNSSNKNLKIINIILERKYLKKAIKEIKDMDTNAFYSVEELKMIKHDPKKEIELPRLKKSK